MKNILWDFDGVILDSMPIRDYGFSEIFKDYNPKDVDMLLKYHRKNGGLSRYVKIKYFFKEILQKDVGEEQVCELASKFSDIMRNELAQSKYLINETLDFIKKNFKSYAFHIVSGSDEKELRYLCSELGLKPYFISIHGSPTPKSDLVRNLLRKYSYATSETCLIGDSINDFEAAMTNGIKFFGYNNQDLMKYCGVDGYISSFERF